MIAKTTLLCICIHVIQVKSIVFAMSLKLCDQSDKAFLNKYDVNNLKKHFIKNDQGGSQGDGLQPQF